MTESGAETERLTSEYDAMKETIPQEIRDSLSAFVSTHGYPVPDAKALYVRKLNLPIVQAQGKGKWVVAYRATAAEILGITASQSFPYEFQPIKVYDRPIAPKPASEKDPTSGNGGFRVKVLGLARGLGPENAYEGPATLMIYNFGDKSTAEREAAKIVSGHLYRIRAKPSRGNSGEKGTIPLLNSTAADPIQEVASVDGRRWAAPIAILREAFPVTPIATILRRPEAGGKFPVYRVIGEVAEKFRGQDRERMFGFLKLVDDSVLGDDTLYRRPDGRLMVWLSGADVAKTSLAIGSRVEALVSGSQTDERNAQREKTGNRILQFNAIVVEVLLDLTPSTELPNPDAPVVPPRPANTSIARDVM